jgi:hypothetical protein
MKLHHDFDLVAGERDFFDAADFDAGQFDTVADLLVLHGVEQSVEAVTAAERFHAAQCLDDGPGGKDRQDHKNAQTGFK